MAHSKQNKAQSLPLNTIVIAILVIIVLLVIIVFFTTRVGETGKSIDDTTANFGVCDSSNPLLTGKSDDNIERLNLAEGETASSALCKSQFQDDSYTLVPGTVCCVK